MDEQYSDDFLRGLFTAIQQHNLHISTSQRTKHGVSLVFAESLFNSKQSLRILQALGIPPLELLHSSKLSRTRDRKAAYYNLLDIKKEYLQEDIVKTRKNILALSHCLSDVIHNWNRGSSQYIKHHRSISEDMIAGYIKCRLREHPDEERLISHADIITAICNYQIYVKAKDENYPDLFLPHQWKNLHVFLRSRSAVPEYFYNSKSLQIALSNGGAHDYVQEIKEKTIDPDVYKRNVEFYAKEFINWDEHGVDAQNSFHKYPGMQADVEARAKELKNAS